MSIGRPLVPSLAALSLVGLMLLPAASASANGAYTHAHISQLAYAFLGPGELRDLLSDPANQMAYENGSFFPDSGYSVDHPYGEHAHWARFRIAFLEYLRATYGGDYSSPEAQRLVAFFLGFSSHGMADQSYDTTILARAFEVDGPEPDGFSIDQYADYFITIDQDIVFTIDGSAPFAELAAVLGTSLGSPVEESVLMEGMSRMTAVAMLQGDPRAIGGRPYRRAWEAYPWLGTHIYNEVAVGSLPWLGRLVAEQWEVLWRRLKATDDIDEDLVLRTVPEDGGVNWPIDASESEAYSRVAIFFGYAIDRDQLRPLITLRDESGAELPYAIQTAYGGRERSLVFLRPDAPLAYNAAYTVEIAPGVEALSGAVTSAPYAFSFRTRCAEDSLSDCPPLDPPLVTGMMPDRSPDAGPPIDAGPPDAGASPPPSTGGCAAAPARGSRGGWGAIGLAAIGLAWARRLNRGRRRRR